MLHLAQHGPIEGKVCLELGAGWVLTHALVCHLLGARRVIACDIAPLARLEALIPAIEQAIPCIPRDTLAPFSSHARVRERFDRLRSIRRFTFPVLKDLGIEYRSPVDLAREPLGERVDFIYSNSVLEHVPVVDVPRFLANVTADLGPGGTMLHSVHLEDHRDSEREPFAFLAIPQAEYPPTLESLHGNRIRFSQWSRHFEELPHLRTQAVYTYTREDKALPPVIDPAVTYVNESDLRTSHVGFYSQRD